MDEKLAFAVLEIGQTKDENEIKNAYRRKLVQTNPEDDPQGFKQLREAYETACAYARKAEQVLVREDTPVNRWMDRVEAVYRNLPERLNIENWKELAHDDVCLGLDTIEEAKQALFTFLAEHFRLTPEIWRLLDDVFLIREEQREYKEKFPPEFVDFMVYQCSREDTFPYEYMEGAPDADYDTYISQLFDLIHRLDDRDTDGAEIILRNLEALPITHPWAKMERARYDYLNGGEEVAVQAAEELIASCKELRILVIGCDIIWESGRRERGAELCRQILEQIPDHYNANRRLAQWHLEQKEYEKAREYCIAALRISDSDESLTEELREINRGLMGGLKEKCTDPSNLKPYLELGWCYLQNELSEEGIALLEGLTPDLENEAEYHSLLGRLYYTKKRFADAAEQGDLWRMAIEKEQPEGEKEKAEIPARLASAWELMAKAHHRLGSSDAVYLEKALEEIRKSIEYQPKELEYSMEEASIRNEQKEYQKVVDVCDRMVAVDDGYFWAYVLRQEAYYHLGKGQEVIDNFYQAKRIFARYPRMYEWTVKAFLEHDQLDDAEDIFKQADEAEVDNLELQLLRAALKRRQAERSGDYHEAYEYCRKVRGYVKEAQTEQEKLAEIDGELAKCCRRLEKYEEGLEVIEEAIRIEPDSRHFWVKAHMLAEQGKTEEALNLLLVCEKDYGSTANICWPIARCYERVGKKEMAVEYFKKVLKDEPENSEVNGEIAALYRKLLQSTENMDYYREALPYANRQLELDSSVYYYIERGLLHMAACQWDAAEADFLEASKLDPDNTHAFNNLGCVYKYTRRFDQAIAAFQEAIRASEKEANPKAYGNLADCYERMGEYEKALEAYQEYHRVFPDRTDVYWDFKEVYEYMGRFEDAYHALEEGFGKNPSEGVQLDQADVLVEMGDLRQAIRICERVAATGKMLDRAYRDLGMIYFYEKEKFRKAVKYFEKALQNTQKNPGMYRNICIRLMKVHKELGNQREVKAYFDRVMESWKEEYGSMEHYEKSLYHEPSRLYDLAICHLLIGDRKTAEMYYERIRKAPMCRRCTCIACSDAIELEGILAAESGDLEHAEQCLERVVKMMPNDRESRYRLRNIRKKLGK
ncbi:tetratricopeptide repeat protein [Hominifimenecus sp. rT4P-3]|uniref:J domain-containing protein n=1 Tax=Hominifimenecus sp. rT4P-3 TaxID=3242979 RepID=UPI003DA69AFB